MKAIVLTNTTKLAFVDDDDYDRVTRFSDWYINELGYVYSTRVKGTPLSFHCFIIGDKGGFIIDHFNGLPSDCRKCNLRHVTRYENRMNTHTLQNNNTSGYRGVNFFQKKWVAELRHDGKRHYIGRYRTKEEAALAYNKKAKEVFGELAVLNSVTQ